jgi:hypothetical protein
MLSLSLELVKVGGYDFPQPCDGPRNSYFFKRPSVVTEFDMSAKYRLSFCGFNFVVVKTSHSKGKCVM